VILENLTTQQADGKLITVRLENYFEAVLTLRLESYFEKF
jgi:hypothetical protein